MRSITFKLVLSFLGISLVSILLIVLFVRYTTDREFRQFTTSSDRSSLTNVLEEYYRTHGSWGGIDNAELFRRIPVSESAPPPKSFNPLTVADQNGKVIRSGSGLKLGDMSPLGRTSARYSDPIAWPDRRLPDFLAAPV